MATVYEDPHARAVRASSQFASCKTMSNQKPIPASSSDETTGMAPFFVATRAA